MRVLGLALAGILFAGAAAAQTAGLPDPYDLMPDGPGKDEVYGICGACHSMHLVLQQRQTRAGWKKLLVWMEAEQGMPALDPALEEAILDYLSRHYGADGGH